jgi:hypothetical protein
MDKCTPKSLKWWFKGCSDHTLTTLRLVDASFRKPEDKSKPSFFRLPTIRSFFYLKEMLKAVLPPVVIS